MLRRLLIVDDDSLNLEGTKMLLESRGYHVDLARSGSEAIAKVRSAPGSFYALVLLDFRMRDLNGAQTAQELLRINPDLYILIHSGDSSGETIKQSWASGAVGFIDKTESSTTFLETIQNWCNKYEETRQTVSLDTPSLENEKLIAEMGLVGRSEAMASVARKVKRYSKKGEHVLVLGETGTGKERIAKALHCGSTQLFFAVNCASYNGRSDLLESELFGHVRGSFTGASQDCSVSPARRHFRA